MLSRQAAAADTKAKLQILPLECVFDFISDGSSGTIVYITPAECGVVIPPDPPGVDQPTSPDPEEPTPVTSPGTSSPILFARQPGQGDVPRIVSVELDEQNSQNPGSIRYVIDREIGVSNNKSFAGRLLSFVVFMAWAGGFAFLAWLLRLVIPKIEQK